MAKNGEDGGEFDYLYEKLAQPFDELVDLLAQADPDDLAELNRRQEERLPEPPARVKRERKPTLVSVAKQAARAGLEVARYEVDPDGKITIVTGKPEPTEQVASDLDRELAAWEARRAH